MKYSTGLTTLSIFFSLYFFTSTANSQTIFLDGSSQTGSFYYSGGEPFESFFSELQFSFSRTSIAFFSPESKTWRTIFNAPAGLNIVDAREKYGPPPQPVVVLLNDGSVYLIDVTKNGYPATRKAPAGPNGSESYKKIYGDALYSISSSFVRVSRDTALTWQLDTSGLGNERINDIALDSLQFVYGTTPHYLFRQHPDSSIWRNVSSFPIQTGFNALTSLFIDRSNRIFVGSSNGVYLSTDGGSSWLDALKNYFARFPHLHERLCNTFTFRSVGIILLNSNFGEMTDAQAREQLQWYQSTLDRYQQDDSVTTIIVCCHHPPFTNSAVVSDDHDVQKYFVPPYLKTPKAKLFFTGHCHSYERFIEQEKVFIVSGGGGGPRQIVETDPEKRRHHDQYKGKGICDFHFCKITTEGKQIRVQMIKIDEKLSSWSIGDEFRLE